MEIISSSKNEKIKNIAALLKSKKERDEQGVFVIEGIRIFRDTFSASPESVADIFITESMFCEKKEKELFSDENLLNRLSDPEKVHVVKDSVFKCISETVSPQGIIGIVRKRQYSLENVILGKTGILVLENIQDPGNLGTMFRTAEAAGMSGIVLSGNCADIYNPKVIRSTMGSIMRVPFVYCDDFAGTLKIMKEKGITLYAAYLHGGEPYYRVHFDDRYAIMIGNEGNGLTEDAVEAADKKIYIPMKGRIESLNAAIAAAILMFHDLRV